MADFLRYVDTDVAPGGVGSEADPFASLNEAEAACQSLGVSGDTVYIYCSGVTADTTVVSFSGWVSGVNYVVQGNNLTGKWDDTKYRIVVAAKPSFSVTQINGTFNFLYLDYSGASTRGFQPLVDASFFGCFAQGDVPYATGAAFYCSGVATTVTLSNCIVYGIGTSGIPTCVLADNGTVNAYHCLACNSYLAGFTNSPDGLLNAVNCIGFNNPNDFSISGIIDHCASDDGTGTNAITGLIWEDEFTDYVNGDFSLESGSSLIGAGATGTGVTEDITGATRPSPPSVGAFEFIVSGATDLVIADSNHAHATDNVTITQGQLLGIDDSTHAHATDNVTITQGQLLGIDDSAHALTSDSVTVTAGSLLEINDSTHAHATDNIDLVQNSTLEIADSSHAHMVDGDLLLEYNLTINDSSHALTSDEVTLFSELVIHSSTHTHIADNVDLTQASLLEISDSWHSHTVDNVTLGTEHTLIINNSLHSHTVDGNIILVQGLPMIFHPPGTFNGSNNKYKMPEGTPLTAADALQDLAGTGPYMFDGSGNAVAKSEAELVSDGVMNNNKQVYGCLDSEGLWQYSDQLTTNQDSEVKEFGSCL